MRRSGWVACRIAQKPLPLAPELVSVEPSCVWVDSSMVVKVALEMSSRRVKPSDIDLDHFASEVADIRAEVRVAD